MKYLLIVLVLVCTNVQAFEPVSLTELDQQVTNNSIQNNHVINMDTYIHSINSLYVDKYSTYIQYKSVPSIESIIDLDSINLPRLYNYLKEIRP